VARFTFPGKHLSMTTKQKLLVMQGVGAVTLLFYPGVVLATIMSVGSQRGGDAGLLALIGYVLLAASIAYPVIWAVLWWSSWRALRRGEDRRALVLSTPPAALVFIGVVGMMVMALLTSMGIGDRHEAILARQQNPLAASIIEFPNGTLNWRELQDEIRNADPALLSTEVEYDGTPLRIALRSTKLASSLDSSAAPRHSLEIVRLLLARGAKLSAAELETDAAMVWVAQAIERGISLPDRGAAQENPLVWTIVTAPAQDERSLEAAIESAAAKDRALLTRVTRAYGTPLRAALLRKFNRAAEQLIARGATLSAPEANTLSVARQLDTLLAESSNPQLRDVYERSVAAMHTSGAR
jgi:hypothetical protein